MRACIEIIDGASYFFVNGRERERERESRTNITGTDYGNDAPSKAFTNILFIFEIHIVYSITWQAFTVAQNAECRTFFLPMSH